MYQKMLTRQLLCDAIYSTVFRSKKPLTRKEICEAIGKHKSPHIIKMIEQLYHARWFERSHVLDHRGIAVYVYSVEGAERKHEACSDLS